MSEVYVHCRIVSSDLDLLEEYLTEYFELDRSIDRGYTLMNIRQIGKGVQFELSTSRFSATEFLSFVSDIVRSVCERVESETGNSIDHLFFYVSVH